MATGKINSRSCRRERREMILIGLWQWHAGLLSNHVIVKISGKGLRTAKDKDTYVS